MSVLFLILFILFVRLGLILFDLLYEAIYKPQKTNNANNYAYGICTHEEYCNRGGDYKDTKNHRRY